MDNSEYGETLPRLAPDQPPADEPLGLTSARDTLKTIEQAAVASREGLRLDAAGNLDWAEAEIREGAFADRAGRFLDEIASLRRQLTA